MTAATTTAALVAITMRLRLPVGLDLLRGACGAVRRLSRTFFSLTPCPPGSVAVTGWMPAATGTIRAPTRRARAAPSGEKWLRSIRSNAGEPPAVESASKVT